MRPMNRIGYNDYRVWATLHLDRLTAHQGGVAACLMLLSPDSELKTPPYTVYPSFPGKSIPRDPVLWHAYLEGSNRVSDDRDGT